MGSIIMTDWDEGSTIKEGLFFDDVDLLFSTFIRIRWRRFHAKALRIAKAQRRKRKVKMLLSILCLDFSLRLCVKHPTAYFHKSLLSSKTTTSDPAIH